MEVNHTAGPSTASTATNSEASISHGDTDVKVSNFSYTWTIHNFSACEKTIDGKLISPKFSCGPSDAYKWNIHLSPGIKPVAPEPYVKIWLSPALSDKTDVLAKYAFSIINARKEKVETLKESQYRDFSKEGEWRGGGFYNFIKRDRLLDATNGLLPDDKLTIFCEVSVVRDTVNVAGVENTTQLDVPQCRLLDDLEALLESKKLSDVTLVAGGQEFQAHKAILMARSPVFSAMFQNNMAERKLSRVDVTDVDSEVLAAMLRFIYTGKTGDLDSMAAGLMAAANKYDLERLKVLCEEALINGLTIENAASRWILSDLHGAERLKERTINFVYTHMKEVMDTPDYRMMHLTHPRLIDGAFRAFVDRRIARGKKRMHSENSPTV